MLSYQEVEIPADHELIGPLDEMIKWVKSSDVLEALLAGRPFDDNDLSDDRLQEKVDNNLRALGDSHTARFDSRKDYDFSEVARCSSAIFEELTGIVKYELRHVAKTWYPKGGYIGWHTDGDGGRFYSTYAEGKSFFRYMDPETKEVITSWDKPGWTFRAFYTDEDNPLWHCVGAMDTRISIGYKFIL